MAPFAKFSWFEIASLFGALALTFLCFVVLAFGINNVYYGETTYGVACIIAGIVSGAVAVLIYRNYHKKKDL